MKKFAIVIALILCAAAAQAGTIMDIQTGTYAEGALVTIENALVTGVLYNGFFISEWNGTAPDYGNGPNAGIWVYAGNDYAGDLVEGQLVNVTGTYIEYFDFSEIDLTIGDPDPLGSYTVVGAHTGLFPSYCVTAADLAADAEPYESVFICVTDGFIIDELRSFGEWAATSVESGDMLVFDDYWYDETTLAVGDCYNWAGGILIYSFGEYKLEPFEGDRGLGLTDCTVGTDDVSFGGVKALYR